MIEELIRRAGSGDRDAVAELEAIADDVAGPKRLVPYHGLLLDVGVVSAPKLYWFAEAGLVARIVEQVDAGQAPERLSQLLLILTNTCHVLAEAAMRRWAVQPPTEPADVYVQALRDANEGGWFVDHEANRRDLCGTVAYEWILRPSEQPADTPACPWCSSMLWTVADLDTADPLIGAALAHTGWTGRLVVRTCPECSFIVPLYSQVTWYLHVHAPCGFAAVNYQQS
ncbi:hypothetical protein [Dactylosporangium sp. NPDC000521]|uniref:hypothetical protein n=1 Tax=Dactylosporangium sp. NPDC000521 TaxID=3363975 RepID=UPI0036D086F5